MPAVELAERGSATNYWFNALGRPKPGVTPSKAQADLRVIASPLWSGSIRK